MKKNVAGQKIGAQMCSATDGSAFTSAVTVYVTGDAGTQAIGSVGAGACTHEGNGYHTYAPAQAETNYDLAAFTFIGTGAIPATVQVFTTFPQTGDSFGLIGTAGAGLTNINLPDQTMNITGDITGNLSGSVGSVTGAVGSVTGNVGGNVVGSVASVVGAVGSVTGLTAANLDVAVSTRLATAGYTAPDNASIAAILIDTAEIGVAGAGLTALATAANLATVAGYIDTEIADIQGRLPAALVGGRMDSSVGAMAANTLTASALAADAVTEIQTGLSTLDAAGMRTAVGLASANLDTQLGAIDDYLDTEIAAIKAKTDNLPAAPAAVGDIPTAIENADTLLNRDMSVGTDSGSPTVRTPRQALRALRNKMSVSGSTLTVTKEDDTTASWTAALTTDAAALPITGIDPAS